jgi:hypothetical protein
MGLGGSERENVEGQETDLQASSVRDVNMGIEKKYPDRRWDSKMGRSDGR